jgi:NAD(P)-dependent dehydrogenase (short-subunit alcohol dehydrogenase family)
MSAKVCLVTGGTSGVGKSIARGLARSGATVILVSRDAARGAAAAEELRALAGHDRIEVMTADLSSMGSVRALADSVRRKYSALHVLSNNAALLTMTRRITPEGVDAIFATNYLGHFLLANLLIDLLKAGAPARVLTVSGQPGAIARIRPRFDDPPGERGWTPLNATVKAALAKVLFSRELARRLEGSGVTSNTFHPGLVRSGLVSHLPWYLRIPASVASAFFSVDSATGCFLAFSPEVEGVTGSFFSGRKAVPFKPPYDAREAALALWESSASLCGLR